LRKIEITYAIKPDKLNKLEMPCEICKNPKTWINGDVLYYKYKCQQVEDFKKLIYDGANVEEVQAAMKNPYLDLSSIWAQPIDWATYNNNAPVLRMLLDDTRIRCSNDAVPFCIERGFTDIIKELLSHPRAGGKHCDPDVKCEHFKCRDLRRYLVLASLHENADLVEFLISSMRVPEKYVAHVPAGTRPANAILCTKCDIPTITFDPMVLVPLCRDCAQTPEKYCMYCHNRQSYNMGRCSMHTDAKLFVWNPNKETFEDDGEGESKLMPTKCFNGDCENTDVKWVQSDETGFWYRLSCGSCRARGGNCRSCSGAHNAIIGEYHICKKTYTLRSGFFYLDAN
jgi:hypothetical protein